MHMNDDSGVRVYNLYVSYCYINILLFFSEDDTLTFLTNSMIRCCLVITQLVVGTMLKMQRQCP